MSTTDSNCNMEDLKMEYKMKYERLVDLHKESIQAFADMVNSAGIHKEAYSNYVNGLKKVGFEKDMKIYNLEEELNDVKSKNAELQKRCLDLESRNSNRLAENAANRTHLEISLQKSLTKTIKQPVTETPITLSTVPKTDNLSPLFLPETPKKISREARRSMIVEAIDKVTPKDDDDKYEFLMEIVLKQKDLLDFYATISGFIAENLNGNSNDSQYGVDIFKMRPQKTPFKDMEMQFLVDYDGDDIEYRPINVPKEAKKAIKTVAPYLEETLYFPSEDAPKLLKTLLDVIES